MRRYHLEGGHRMVRDLTKLFKLIDKFHAPLIFSLAGGNGINDHVRAMVSIIKEITAQEGVISGCGTAVPDLTEADIEVSPRLVAQMGPEPFLPAMTANFGFDIIVVDRAYDLASYVAYAAFKSSAQPNKANSLASQRLWGSFTHLRKILECGGLCSRPKSPGAIAAIYDGTFDISLLDPESRCTPISVSAYTLYEKSRPNILYGPGGYLDVNNLFIWAAGGREDRQARVLFKFSRDVGQPYQVKLEEAHVIRYWAMYTGCIKDHVSGEKHLDFHIYGQNRVLALPDKTRPLSEMFLIGEALASLQELATKPCIYGKSCHCSCQLSELEGYIGKFRAYGLGGKPEIELGICPKFSIYHLMNLVEEEEALQIHTVSEVPSQIGITQGTEHASTRLQFQPQVTKKISGEVVQNGRKDPQRSPKTLGDLASVLRSKNAGPFETTFDVMFDSEDVYRMVKETDIIRVFGFFDQAMAFKATTPRLRHGQRVGNGIFMEYDVNGSQKYLELLNPQLPSESIGRWDRSQNHQGVC
ncbi:hypothetical protein K469DRAFT_727155 [Zopfia rhizophila CBS 207.26]|uniref:DUF4387 domain-containing protein n=1 Tax=Zopfia rhizophila CBS 207.26 TaxID=1314779 RepID=A0A6A6DYN9_9PEZI|nr:hypothetical protein K469DRAFT_727155 [Zopfia rhizophila CBS 207.26]